MSTTAATDSRPVIPPRRSTADPGMRDATIKGLRDLADWLEAHPGAPVRQWGTEIQVNPGGTAEVERVAGELGIKKENPPHAVRAPVRFGPVAYILYAPSAEVTR